MSDEPRVSFRKGGRLRPAANRKRRHDDEDEDAGPAHEQGSSGDEEEIKIVQRSKSKRPNPLVQSTSSKKLSRPVAGNDESEDSEEEERNRMLGLTYKSSKTAESLIPKDMGATATLETETEFAMDAQAQFERTQKVVQEGRGKADDKVYRGMSAYGQLYAKKDSAAGNASSGMVRKGPIRAPTFLRQSVRWDYQPDLCKDYKETGFCGFGDSCKFLHDRTDYKHGWELEREWKEGRYGKDDADVHAYEISDNEDDLPFKCVICRESFVNPVITKCKHYFCEKCALDHYRKTQKCYICEKNTGGVFNPAKEIIARLKGETAKKSKRADDEDGDSGSDQGEHEDVATVETLPQDDAEEDETQTADGGQSEYSVSNIKSTNSAQAQIVGGTEEGKWRITETNHRTYIGGAL